MPKPKLTTHEREILLKEIHHRTRNNLQIISSLLALTFSKFDDEVKASLEESMARIATMAIVHEQLYEAKDLKNITSVHYVNLLINNVKNGYYPNYRVQLETCVEEFFINLDKAVPLGLIINEILLNVFKYAFIVKKSGGIFFSLKTNKQKVELIIRDNGVGIENMEILTNYKSLGFRLISNLTSQLKGHLEISIKNGVEYKIVF